MNISDPQTLCDWLMEILGKVPALSGLNRMEVIESLEEKSLKQFFDYDTALGLYVHGGEFEGTGMQIEVVAAAVIIGCRDLSSSSASLGTNDDPGAWQYLEAVRQSLTGMDLSETNIQGCVPVRWRTIISRGNLAVLGMDLRIRVARPVRVNMNTALDTYGAGYGGDNA